jgi:hypothetical protein
MITSVFCPLKLAVESRPTSRKLTTPLPIVAVGSGVGENCGVGVKVGVRVAVTVPLTVAVGVSGVPTGVAVLVGRGIAVKVGDGVEVIVAVRLGVREAVAVLTFVAVLGGRVGVNVGCGLLVAVGLGLGLAVGVATVAVGETVADAASSALPHALKRPASARTHRRAMAVSRRRPFDRYRTLGRGCGWFPRRALRVTRYIAFTFRCKSY